MRFLLVIPVFVLFLSNVPFIQEMPMEEMMARMEEESCPMNKPEASCHPGEMPEENSCQRTDATCICICFFQYAAPANDIKTFQFEPANEPSGRTGYLQVKWNDPHIASPGQPPDFV